MAQPQFISHAQVVPPSLVPRRGLGIFGALAIVLAILGGALTGGLVLLEKTTKTNLENARKDLTALKSSADIDSIKQVQDLQMQINAGASALSQHIYATQAVNFIEKNTLDDIRIASISFDNGSLKGEFVAPGYIAYAQQIQYFQKQADAVEALKPGPPMLSTQGGVSFVFEIKLKDSYLRTKPAPKANMPAIGGSSADAAGGTLRDIFGGLGGGL